MKGILIDCYRKRDEIILWIKCDGKNLRVRDSFTPFIYVQGKELRFIKDKLSAYGIPSHFTKKNSFAKDNIWVLEIQVPQLSQFHSIVKLVEQITQYALEINNADMKLEEYYFFEKKLFPLAKVEFELNGDKIQFIKATDEAEDIHYSVPEFSYCKVQAKTKNNLHKGMNTSLEALQCNNTKFSGEEKAILEQFKQVFEQIDPDILWVENGNLVIPFLKQKFYQHDIHFQFNRFEDDDFKFEKGTYYHSYSKYVFRTTSIFLKGRLHFDMRSFFANDTGLHGILDGSRVCRQRIQRTEMRSAGAAVTMYLLYTAYQHNFLLPYKVGILERFKTLKELYNCDRGSMIFEPRVGFHTNVVEFDYVSLYPNIMNKHNLSPETLFCKCCVPRKVPGLHYYYCQKRRGIVSMVAQQLVERRMALKEQKTPQAKEKVDYLKWLLVTMFGYQAFKNRKIGTIENHESIQAYARETILRAVRTAEQYDWEVIHGIIDSIYIKKKEFSENDIHRLGREIFYNTGLELNFEGRYRWMVFLPSVVDPAMPVSSHFYGVFEDGEIKCRGIEARRKDVPKIVANMQLEMIEALAPATDEDEFRASFPKVYKILRNYCSHIERSSVDELMAVCTISKLDYVHDIAQKIIVGQMKAEGYDVQPGMTIAYVIRDSKNKNPFKRYITLDSFDGVVDVQKYRQLMVRATFSILQPFGVTEEMLFDRIKGITQMRIKDYEQIFDTMIISQNPK